MTTSPLTIISGGQTGADRAALDFAIEHNISHGGWCPKGRIAEDGPLAKKYHLKETPTEDYAERTLWNVRDSDGTVLFTVEDELSGGTLATLKFAEMLNKPVIHICEKTSLDPAGELKSFIEKNKIKTLNIAGPRESKEPAVYGFVKKVLGTIFRADTGVGPYVIG